MNINVKVNNFIPLKNLSKVLNLQVSLNDYNFENGKLVGDFCVVGSYLTDYEKNDSPVEFNESLPLEIIFTNDIKFINNIEIINYEYFEVERRGIEIEISINVTYEDNNCDLNYNEITNNITQHIDEKLQEELDIKNVERNELIFPSNESKTRIRIF